MVRAKVNVIRLPKTESAQDIVDCEREIARIEEEIGLPVGTTKMMAAVESAAGVLNAKEIAMASKRLIGIAIGAEDYVTDLKTNRSPEGIELLFGRSMILLAARAAGIAAIDTVYSDVNNEEGFRAEVAHIKQLGFDGKSVINPRQIGPVYEIYTPTEKEIEKSLAIMDAIEEANAKGSGVIKRIETSGMRGDLATEISNGLMDYPVVFRSHGGRAYAIESGQVKIDVAFLGAPSCDPFGNANGYSREHDNGVTCGSMGYAKCDAQFAEKVVIITDNLVPYPNAPFAIPESDVDYVVKVDCIINRRKKVWLHYTKVAYTLSIKIRWWRQKETLLPNKMAKMSPQKREKKCHFLR